MTTGDGLILQPNPDFPRIIYSLLQRPVTALRGLEQKQVFAGTTDTDGMSRIVQLDYRRDVGRT